MSRVGESWPGNPEQRRALRKLLERARKAEAQPPRGHHLVPKSYLRRWEGSDGRLRVTEVTPRRTYFKTAKGAARQTDYYRVEADEIDPDKLPPLLFELMLGEVEGNAVAAINALIAATDPYEIDPELGSYLAWFVAFQWVRGEAFRTAHREMISEVFREMHADITDEGIAMLVRDSGEEATPERLAEYRQAFADLRERRIRVTPQKASIIGLSAEIAATIGEQLIGRRWVLYRAPLPLITCDEPVVVIGGPGLLRRRQVGIARAGVVLFPLAPDTLLAMFHPLLDLDPAAVYPELTLSEVAECNLEIAANSTRWIFEHPDMHYAETLALPIRPPVSSVEVLHSSDEDTTRLLHSYRNSRWAFVTDPPPWPVTRWWRAGWSLPIAGVDWLAAQMVSDAAPLG